MSSSFQKYINLNKNIEISQLKELKQIKHKVKEKIFAHVIEVLRVIEDQNRNFRWK